MLSLDLTRIRTADERFERTYEPEQLTPDDAYSVVAPVALAFDIRRNKSEFHLTGTIATTLELPCSRCLEPLLWPVAASFDLRYQPLARNVGEGELEVHEDDLSTAFYQNDAIDLELLMKEQFQLALPMKPLCAGDCQGLCPVCGTNLNRGACTCTRTWEDPRLAALKALKH
jgi:uncharacterized protein